MGPGAAASEDLPMVPLVQADFTTMLSHELHLRGHAVELWELAEWVRCLWPHIQDDPDPYRWAGEFLEAARGTMATSGRPE